MIILLLDIYALILQMRITLIFFLLLIRFEERSLMKTKEVGHNFLAHLGKTKLRPGGIEATNWLI